MASIRFPADLRPPDREGYSDNYEVIQSEFVPEIGASRRRNRFTSAPREFSAQWTFTQSEFTIFDSWYESAIRGGEAEFDIQFLDDAYGLAWYTVTATEPFAFEIVQQEGIFQFSVKWQLRAKAPSFGSVRPAGTDELGGACSVGVYTAPGYLRAYTPFRGFCEISITSTILSLLQPLNGSCSIGMYQLPSLRDVYSAVAIKRETDLMADRETDSMIARETD